jgi:hypothetical protein
VDETDGRTAPIGADSGTGWPEGSDEVVQTHTADPWSARAAVAERTSELPAASAVEPADEITPGRRRPGWRPWAWWRAGRSKAFWLALIAGVVAILLIVSGLIGALPHLSNPFKARTVDRTGPVLLLSIQDLARFEAASGNFQVVIDVQKDHQYIPDILLSERSLFVAAGTVDAYVDFSQVGAADVVASADRKTVTITLPAAQLEPPNLDPERSYVFAVQEGFFNRIQDMFGSDPNKLQELYVLARQKIAAAAVDSQLAQRAQQNTRQMLNELLRSLGFTSITINFPAT